ncbi:MAG: HAMP domain-containing protein [Chlorobi bacterium]|nr:HAMP domain-containing protein [Chlorobiota bacterium]
MYKNSFLNRYIKIRSSIYGQVIYVIVILSIVLFAIFGILFRSVNEKYMKSVIQQCGNRVASLIEGSLYYSMLENDKTTLRNTLKIINTLPGISDVNMYDNMNNLVYTSSSSTLSADSIKRHKSNCKACHADIESMFNETEKSYRVINTNSDCEMNQGDNSHRHLFIKAPILNQKSCNTNACHVHNKNEKVLGSLIIKIPLNELDAAVQESSNDYYVLATIMTLALLSFLILFTRKKIRNPLSQIIKASEAVSKGDISTRLNISNNQLDDMRKVSSAFNNMLDNLNLASNELKNWSHQLEYKVQKKTEELKEVQNELIHIERIASLGKLSSSVAHEINNPLSGVLTYTKLVQKQLSKQDFDNTKKESMLKHLKMIETETKRCGDIVKGLLDFSKKDQKDFEPKHLHKILKETNELMMHQIKMENINFICEFNATSDMVYCSPNQIKQACVAILVNAIEAVLDHGEITMKTSNPDLEHIKLDITDNGSGIASDDIPLIFEPFYSKKQKASGIGLGLAIVHGIVQSHKGKTDVSSEPGKHTTISIILPLIDE